MVERLWQVFNKEWGGLHEAAFLLGGTAILSQALGLIRDRMLAHQFGAGQTLDVYYAAFRIPDLIYASIASFVAVTVLIPFFLERIDREGGNARVRAFMDTIFTVFTLMMIVVSFVAFVAMPWLGKLVVPGFSGAQYAEYVLLSRMLLLSPFLLGISNLFGSVTQSLRRFVVFAAGPVLYNIGIIFGIFALMPSFGIAGVIAGVILGALMHVCIQLPVLAKEDLLPWFTFRPNWRDALAVVKLSIPRTLALSATQISIIVLIQLSSHMEVGSIAIFTFAMNLQSIPLSVVGMSYSVAAFPTLAKLWTGGNKEEFAEHIIAAARHIMFWSFPAIVLFIVLRAQIVRTILGSGAFDWTATRLTAAALALFVISVVAQNLVLLFTRAFYAMGRTRTPLRANVIGGVLVVAISLLFLYVFRTYPTFRYFAETLLRVEDIRGTAMLMLPLGYSLGMIANVFLLLYLLRREFPNFLSSITKAFLHTFSASIIMGIVAYYGLQLFAKQLDQYTLLGIFLQGLFAGTIGIIAGVFLLRLMENRELEEIRSALHHKFWKQKPIVAEQESF